MPTQQMGISQIKVPKMPNQIRGASHPEDYQELIANHEAHSMVWERATNVMLEKDLGNPCIHHLRIIHLFEADFNLYMKLQ